MARFSACRFGWSWRGNSTLNGPEREVFQPEGRKGAGSVMQPVQMGGGDEALRVCGQRLEEGNSARGVQFSENVVNQVDGCMSRFFRKQG